MTEEQPRVPKLRFPGFTDAWEQRKLGDVAEIIGGGTPSTGILIGMLPLKFVNRFISLVVKRKSPSLV